MKDGASNMHKNIFTTDTVLNGVSVVGDVLDEGLDKGMQESLIGKTISHAAGVLRAQGMAGPIALFARQVKSTTDTYTNAELFGIMEESMHDYSTLSLVGEYFIKNKNLFGALRAYHHAANAFLEYSRTEKRLVQSEALSISKKLDYVAHQFYALAATGNVSDTELDMTGIRVFGKGDYHPASQALIIAYDFRKATGQSINSELSDEMRLTANALSKRKDKPSLEQALSLYSRLDSVSGITRTASTLAWNHSISDGLYGYKHTLPALIHKVFPQKENYTHNYVLISDTTPELTALHTRAYTSKVFTPLMQKHHSSP